MNEEKQAFLNHFLPNHRSTVMNQFLEPIRREGITTADAIVAYVSLDAFERSHSRYSRDETLATQRTLIEEIERDGTGAINLAEYCLWWESLSSEEKHKIRAPKNAEYARQYMQGQPPTEKQIKFLRSLGCTEQPRDKAHASELIEKWK